MSQSTDLAGNSQDLDEIRDLIDYGDFALAIRRLLVEGKTVADDARRGRLLALSIICHQRSGRQSEAEQEARNSVREDGQNREFLLGAAVEFADMGEYLLAEELLRELCSVDPDDHQSMFHLATVLDRDGRLEEASRVYDEAIALEPEFASNYNHKAGCLRDLEQIDQAIVAYQHYLKLEPEDTFEWISLALVCSDQERFDEAYQAFEQARVLDPASPALYHHWAITAVQRNDRCTLTRCLEALTDQAPRDWRCSATRALLHEYDGDVQAGWVASRRSVELADRQGDYDSVVGAISTALRYACRHHLKSQAADILERCFVGELMDDDVLDAIRLLNDKWSLKAGDFEVIVDSSVAPEVLERFEPESGRDATGYRFVRHYQVFAESAEQAGEMVLHFETHMGAPDLVIQEIQEISFGFETCLGVVSRSNGYFIYLGSALDDGGTNDVSWGDDGEESAGSNGLFFPRF